MSARAQQDAGKGELNAAYGGLGMIMGVVMPMIWGTIFKVSQDPRSWLARIFGKGSCYTLCALLQLASWAVARSADPATLFLDERPAAAPQGEGEGDGGGEGV